MTFQERNEMVESILKRFKTVHDLYTSNTRQLTDEEWVKYIDTMEAITAKYKDSNVYDFAGAMQMVFLNDTEYMQKRLRKHEMQQN